MVQSVMELERLKLQLAKHRALSDSDGRDLAVAGLDVFGLAIVDRLL